MNIEPPHSSALPTWITVCGQDGGTLASELDLSVESRLKARQFRSDEIEYVRSVNYSPIKGRLEASEQELNTLRRLCQAWDIELRPIKITSHRPIVGPVVVACKRLMFPIVRVFLKDLVTQQRDFNAASISLLGTLLSEQRKF